MKEFSTVLFVDGSPVGYRVSQENQDNWILNPAENPARIFSAPVLRVALDHGSWKVEGTRNPDLVGQVIREAEMNFPLTREKYSAAP